MSRRGYPSFDEPTDSPIWGPRIAKALRHLWKLDRPLSASEAVRELAKAVAGHPASPLGVQVLAVLEAHAYLYWNATHQIWITGKGPAKPKRAERSLVSCSLGV